MRAKFKNEIFPGGALRAARLLLLPLLFSAATQAGAVANQTFNYQGFLLNKNTNLPVETPQDIKFVIYGSASGGTALFTEGRCNVGVNKGRYDAEIGSSTAGGIPADIFVNNPNLWLEIQVDPDGSCSGFYEAMSPRMRLQASPYAFNSLYASTAAAATPVFAADTIGALPVTANGAITISTNLFVQGGISVGSISPGQKLAVSGIVESKGVWPDCSLGANPTCGIKFADGSIQYEAAAVTMWKAAGNHVYSINPGNVAIGQSNPDPLARLHVSSAAGDTGNIFMVSTGSVAGGFSQLFTVNGLGEVRGGSYYGFGGTLNGVVRSTGDAMSGPLTLMGSSLTVTSAAGAAAPKLRLNAAVELSSASAAHYGGIYISSNVYVSPTARYYGDGGGLYNLFTYDNTKIWRTGDTMTGQLTLGYSTTTLLGSTLTVTGNAFSVGGSTLSVRNGNTQLGGSSYLGRLTVTGNIVATSSITAQQGLYAPNAAVSGFNGEFTTLTSGIGTFNNTAVPDTDGDNYSVTSSSGIVVIDPMGKVKAAYFQGSGAMLTGVLKSTDTSKVSKFGDTMTGNLEVRGSSLTIASYGAHTYALSVGSAAYMSSPRYLTVTNSGNVGVQVDNPTEPLDVLKRARISYTSDLDTEASLVLNSYYAGYVGFASVLAGTDGGGPQIGVLGTDGNRNLIYRVNAIDMTSGGEVFRVTSNNNSVNPYWRFGIGTTNPQDRFHVAVNVQVSSVGAAVPTLFVSTSTGRIGVSTAAASMSHNLTVGRGIIAGSSITAQGGFFGDGLGITRISTAAIPNTIWVGSITALSGGLYDGVVFSTAIYSNSKMALGREFFAPTDNLHVRGTVRFDQKYNSGESVVLRLFPDITGAAYLQWEEGAFPMEGKGVLGMEAGTKDLVYRGGALGIGGGVQAFRIKPDGKFIVGTSAAGFAATEMFQVAGNMIVSNSNASASSLFVSPAAVGVSTGAPKERLHVASSMLVSASDRANAAVFISTETGFTGIGTGYPQAPLSVNGNILGSGNYTGAGSPPVTGGGARFMWIPSEGALRAGGVATTQWDTVGNYSIGLGYDPIVTSDYSAILGGLENKVESSPNSVIAGGYYNTISGESSAIPGGRSNVIRSSYSFAGGYNNYLDTDAIGTFVWGYDYPAGNYGEGNTSRVTSAYSFLIDPVDNKHYKVGIRTPAPQTALDVNGDAQFGSGVTKSTFTAEGLWVPRSVTTAALPATAPDGAVLFNSTIGDLCVRAAGAWYVVGSKKGLLCN